MRLGQHEERLRAPSGLGQFHQAHRWDAVEGRGDLQSPRLPHFFETCKLVFAAPEFAPPQRRKKDRGSRKEGGKDRGSRKRRVWRGLGVGGKLGDLGRRCLFFEPD